MSRVTYRRHEGKLVQLLWNALNNINRVLVNVACLCCGFLPYERTKGDGNCTPGNEITF